MPRYILAAALLLPLVTAQSRIDLSKIGPQVGQHVPDFTLADQNGATRTLESLMGSKGAMLVFFRSADW